MGTGRSSQTTKTATYDADDEMQTSVPGDGNVAGATPSLLRPRTPTTGPDFCTP